MKGVVFTQLLEMVENKFGFDVLDEVLKESNVDGIYIQTGNYDISELVKILQVLVKLTNESLENLLYMYGKYLFTNLVKIYPSLISEYKNSFELISNLEDVIHPEVAKLYPDSEHPTFEMQSLDDKKMEIIYKSKNPLMYLAKGLMAGCKNHYNEDISIDFKLIDSKKSYKALFTLIKH